MIARFRGLTFDDERRQVLDPDGVVLHLTPKAFTLLSVLIANAPRVMPKDELHALLWPGVFVSDATLVSVVKELRRVLADRDADAPIIRTSRGVGYAFGVPFDASAQGPESEPEPETTRQARAEHWIVTADRRIALGEGENLIGRTPESVVWLDVAGVSRLHARIVVHRRDAEIEDLGSKNGTLVRDVRLTARTRLHAGDSIQIGPVTVTYAFTRGYGSTATMSSRR